MNERDAIVELREEDPTVGSTPADVQVAVLGGTVC